MLLGIESTADKAALDFRISSAESLLQLVFFYAELPH